MGLKWGDNLNKNNKKVFIHFSLDKKFKEEIEEIAEYNKLKVAPYIKMILNIEIQKYKKGEK